tara:strand:- start:183 stop:416 length:234 start_codon:yes stop_codon:yes gene_type:complete
VWAKKKILGCSLIVLSAVLYLSMFSLPFSNLKTKYKIILGVSLYGTSYLTIFIGLSYLGPEIVDKLKTKLKSIWNKR